MFVRIHIGPARVPIIIRTPWTAFSAKEMRVRGGPGEDHYSIGHQEEGFNVPETQVVWVKFLMLCWASFLERLRTITIALIGLLKYN